MASSAAVARLRELVPAPGPELSVAGAAVLAEGCRGLLLPGGGDAEAVCSALDALCAAGGDAMRRHADGLAPLVVGRLGDGDAAVREAARRFLVLLMEMKEANARMENTEPNTSMTDDQNDHCTTIEMESSDTSQVRKKSKEKITARDVSLSTDNAAGIYSPGCALPSAIPLATEQLSEMPLSDATVVTIVQDKAECNPDIAEISQQVQAPEDPSKSTSMSPTINMKGSGKLQKLSPDKVNSNKTLPGPQQAGKHRVSTPKKSIGSKGPLDSYTPNFRRPLLSKQMTNWFYASTRSDLDEKKLILGEMVSNMNVPSSLSEALSLGVNPRSDWMIRVYAFSFLRQCLLEHGPKGIQEVAQSFEKVMRFVCRYLDDPHHKVAQASLSSLAEIMPAFKKPFEHYLDKTLPHIFSRINDPKESIKQQCSAIMKLASEIYSVDSLLPALLRSLDEHKSPKLKLSIIDFANALFVKCTVNAECYYCSSFLKPWFGKLALLFKDKNNKLKEVAVVGFSSIYSHYDPASVLSFLVSMSMEEQKRLRWSLKQLIPTIESDLEEFLQERRHRQKTPSFDPFTAKSPLHPTYQSAKSPLHPAYQSAKSPLHPAYQSAKSPLHPSYRSAKSPIHPAYQSNAVEGIDLFSSGLQCLPNISLEPQEYSPGKIESESSNESYSHKAEMLDKNSSTMRSRNDLARGSNRSVVSENTGRSVRRDLWNNKRFDKPNASEMSIKNEVVGNNCQDHEEAANRFKEVSKTNGHYAYTKNVHQMLSSLLDMLDDPDEPTRELALSLLVEVLEKQRKTVENCIETLIVKLLHATKDAALKVVNQAHICLTTVVTQFDPLRCLQAIASQLACQDEKLILISINSLSKLVIRLSQENLMAHLSTFLPALLHAFENHSPYVRKAVMVCLVDTYLKLGPALLPHLEGLDSTQLQLVTAYANRVSHARVVTVDG